MKFSFQLPVDGDHDQRGELVATKHPRYPALKAKFPVTVFNRSFNSTITATAATTTFSLSTNFPSFPSVKLSYTPTASPSLSDSYPAVNLTLKSGIGLFGSPNDSPLVFSAHFPLSLPNHNPRSPTFSLRLKPRLGNFSLARSTSSSPNSERTPKVQSFVKPSNGESAAASIKESNGLGSGGGSLMQGSSTWEELKLEPCDGNVDNNCVYINGDRIKPISSIDACKNADGRIFSRIRVRARTLLPITKHAVVNIGWGVNLPVDAGMSMPFLTLNKIGIERVGGVKEASENKSDVEVGDFELWKRMHLWMRRDLEAMQKENSEMKQCLEDVRLGIDQIRAMDSGFEKKGSGKRESKPMYFGEKKGDLESGKSKRSGGEENGRELDQSLNSPKTLNDLESELRKAIKSAST